MGTAYIVDAVRTPRGKGKETGGLHGAHPHRLVATCLAALPERVDFDPGDVEDVVLGCVIPVNEQGGVISRHAVLEATWPQHVTGVMLSRYCGSAQQADKLAAMV